MLGREDDDHGGDDLRDLLAALSRLLHCLQRIPIHHLLQVHSGESYLC